MSCQYERLTRIAARDLAIRKPWRRILLGDRPKVWYCREHQAWHYRSAPRRRWFR